MGGQHVMLELWNIHIKIIIIIKTIMAHPLLSSEESMQLPYSAALAGRGQIKEGPQAKYYPQNLVRAHKMLRSRAQMALQKVGSFHTWCIKDIRKTALKIIEGPQFVNTRGSKWPLKFLTHFYPWALAYFVIFKDSRIINVSAIHNYNWPYLKVSYILQHLNIFAIFWR